jgi:hypothetical protein
MNERMKGVVCVISRMIMRIRIRGEYKEGHK